MKRRAEPSSWGTSWAEPGRFWSGIDTPGVWPCPSLGLITHCALVPTYCSNRTGRGFGGCTPTVGRVSHVLWCLPLSGQTAATLLTDYLGLRSLCPPHLAEHLTSVDYYQHLLKGARTRLLDSENLKAWEDLVLRLLVEKV